MRSEMRHEARQVPSWLIFDVRQKMKTYVLLFVFLLSEAMSAVDRGAATFALECGGKALVCTHLAQVMFGGPTQHFFVVREAQSDFKDLRVHVESRPYRPGVPYLSIGSFTFPLSHFGVYFVKKDGDRTLVELLKADLPKKEDRKSVEEFICLSLRRES